MRRMIASSTLLVAMTVPAANALAGDDGSAPLKIKGEPSKTLQLGFDLPDDWTSDLPGPALNRGVYGRDLPAGDATCRITVVTRGETSNGITQTRPRVRFRFDGGMVSFKAIERHGRWFRSGTTDAERAQCTKQAPREIATGLRTILGSVVVERR